MATINVKLLREKVSKMLSAWLEGAAEASFMGIKRDTLAALSTQAETVEEELDDLRAQVKMKEDELADINTQMSNMTVAVGNGVRGDANFGDDSALYGAMGFVRKSERKSGLTRKKSVK